LAEKTVFQSQLEDTEIVRNLKQSGVLQEAVQEIAGTAEAASIGTGDLESAIESLRAGNTDLNSPDTTEAIVMAVGYPSLLIRNGEYEEPKDAVWKSRLNPSRSIIKGVIRCVGRIDLKGHPNRMGRDELARRSGRHDHQSACGRAVRRDAAEQITAIHAGGASIHRF
jgi:endonuclease G, mitochondrial